MMPYSNSESLKIDGIKCYASDPSAPTAAYVAEQMGLLHPHESVNPDTRINIVIFIQNGFRGLRQGLSII
jgi:hypothetical protein